MSGILFYAAVAACFLVLLVLLTGVTIFARGGPANRKWSNKIMRLRVVLQLVAVILIVLVAYFARQGN
jgi:hypothetical protein